VPQPVPSYRLAGASGSLRSQADVRCVTCTLDASAIQAVRSVAVDALGEFTVSMAVVAWVLERFWARGPATLLVPSLAEDGEGMVTPFAAAPTQGHTVRSWLGDVLARYETLMAESVPWAGETSAAALAEVTDCAVHDSRVHASVDRIDAWRTAALRVCTEGVGAGHVALHYDAARCDPATMAAFADAMADAFTQLADRGGALDRWSPLSAEEHATLRQWGTGDVPQEEVADALRPVPERIDAVIRANPDAPALRCGDLVWTYSRLDAAARRVTAAVARTTGPGGMPGDPTAPVAICMRRGPWLIAAILGVLRSGRAYVPLDPHSPASRLLHSWQDAGVAAVLTDAAIVDGLPPTVCPVVVVDDGLPEAGEASPAGVSAPTVHPTDLAYVIYTSGSTGVPKGCLIEHRQLSHYLTWAVRYYWGGRPATMALFSSVAFDMPVTTIFGPLLTGGTLVLFPDDVGVDVALRTQFAAGSGIDTVKLTPSHILMLEALRLEASDVHLAIVGGEAMTAVHRAVLHRLAPQMRVVNEYGPTEATVGCVIEEVMPTGDITIGRPIARMDAWVLDSAQQLVPVGVRGELCVGGEGVGRGYLHRPDLTAEKFVAHPVFPGRRLYRTGDDARWRTDGRLECFGRLDGQVKIRGHRIELGEIEAALCACDGVREACALTEEATDAAVGTTLIAAVVPREGHAPPTPHAIRRALRDRLHAALIPSRIVVLDRLPLNANGKVDRRRLHAAMDAAATMSAPALPVQGVWEQTLAALYTKVLGAPVDSADADFVALGGHSLRAMELLAAIHEAFGVDVPLSAVFDARTLRALAGQIAAAGGAMRTAFSTASPPSTRPRIAPTPTAPHYPLSHEQRRLWVLDHLEADRAVYSIVAPVLLEGPLDRARLARALDAAAYRHESLRTQFVVIDGEPRQRVSPTPLVPLQVVQDPALSNPDACRAWLAREALEPVPLFDGAPWRATLLVLDASRHVLVITQHHIVTDEQSARVLITDLLAAYEADAPLPPLPLQYRDYVRWQQRYLRSPAASLDRAYWLDRLAPPPPPLALPTDRSRPDVKTSAGGRLRVAVSAARRQAIEARARAQHASPYMGWLALCQVAMRTFSGQESMTIGTPVSGRREAGLTAQIGMYVNTVVLTGTVHDAHTFVDCLRAAQQTATHAFEHAAYPFDLLLEELAITRDPSRSPLFDVLLTYEEAWDAVARPTALRLSDLTAEVPLAKFDLSLGLREQPDGTALLELEYNADLFDAARVGTMSDVLLRMLDDLVAAPDVPLASFAWWRPAIDVAVTMSAPNAVSIDSTRAVALPWETDRGRTGDDDDARLHVMAQLQELWRTVLQVDAIGPDDDFFALGGDSILALQVVARARAQQIPLSVRQLFAHPTVASLARVVREDDGPADVFAGSGGLTPLQAELLEPCTGPLPAAVRGVHQSVLLDLPATTAPGSLIAALNRVLAHHDALRLCVRRTEGEWRQEVEAAPPVVEQRHVTDDAAIVAACHQLQQELDPSRGHMMRAVLFTVEQRPPRLLLLAHHLVVDGVSWRILLDDLALLCTTPDAELAPVTRSMSAWAAVLAAWAAGAGQTERDYWLRATESGDAWDEAWAPSGAVPHGVASATATVTLDIETTHRLLTQSGRAYGTTVEELLLAALLAALTEATGSRRVLVDLEHHGRTALPGVDLARSVGWFTARYPVCVCAPGNDVPVQDDPGRWLVEVKETLRAVPTEGIGYGALRTFDPDAATRDRLSRSAAAVQFNYLGRTDATLSLSGWGLSDLDLGEPTEASVARRHALEVTALVRAGCCEMSFGYDPRRLSTDHVTALSRAVADLVATFIAHAERPDVGMMTPSDVPVSGLSRDEIARVVASVPGAAPPRARVEDLVACTPVQEGLLYHWLRGTDGDAYHEQWVFTLDGAFDASAFQQAWDMVTVRHPALRTVFRWRDVPHPVQVILPHGRTDWVIDECRGATHDELLARATAAMAEDRAHPFDLAGGPLQRVRLLLGADNTTVVCWSHHHIVLDGWSTQLVVRDVVACYADLQHHPRRAVPWPRRSASPRDYVRWQAGRDTTRLREYWSGVLGDMTAPTPLPAALPIAPVSAAPHDQGAERVRCARVLTAEQTRELTNGARAQRITLSTLARAAWALVLAGSADVDDVLFGVTLSGRPPELPDMDDAVGLYIVTVPLRVQVDRRRRVSAWLRSLHHQQAELESMASYPATAVHRCSRVPRDQSLFDSLVVVENYPLREVAPVPGALQVTGLEVRSYTHYALALTVLPGECCEVTLDLDPVRIDTTRAATLLEQVALTMHQLATTPQATLGSMLPARRGAFVRVPLARPLADRLREGSRHRGAVAWYAAAAAALARRYCGHEQLMMGFGALAADPVTLQDDDVLALVPLTRLATEGGDTATMPLDSLLGAGSDIADITRSAEERVEQTPWDLRVLALPLVGAEAVALSSDSGRFDVASLQRAGAHLVRLLEHLVGTDAVAVSTVPLLSDYEQAQLADWNTTTVTYPAPHTLAGLVTDGLASLAARGTSEPIVRVPHEGRDWTAAAFDRCTTQLAHRLRQQHGVGPDVLVGVFAERSSAMAIALVAILKAGGAYVPFDPALPTERLAHQLADSGVQVMLLQGERGDLRAALDAAVAASGAAAPTLIHVTADNEEDAAAWMASTEPLTPIVEPHHLAYMIYTSGSTGRPKGALNTQGGVANRLRWMQATYPLGTDDRILQKTPYSFDVSVWELFWPFLSGAPLVFAAPGGHTDSAYLAQLMCAERISVVHFVPSMLQVFVQDPSASAVAASAGGAVRHVMVSGEALPAPVVARTQQALPGVAVHNLYGPTEAAVDVSAWSCPRLSAHDVVPIGAPIANTTLHVLDPHGAPVPPGITGALWIGGVQVGRGYHRRPELTAERFRSDPWRADGRLYRTGDLARWRPDGTLEYLGREDHQVKLHGYRIELGEIETVLSLVDGVASAVVIVEEGAAGQAFLAAHLESVPGHDAEVTEPVARAACARHLPAYMVPRTFRWWPSLPRLSNGKLDRGALGNRTAPSVATRAVSATDAAVAVLNASVLSHEPVVPTGEGLRDAPRDHTERVLQQLWSDVLRTDRIGRHDTFFDLGGDSLTAVRLASRIEAAFGVPVPLALLLDQTTIASLATTLRAGGTEAAWTPLATLSRHGSGAPLFLFPGAGGNVLAFEPLIRRLAGTRPLYGIQAVGLDGHTPPYTDVPTMAAAMLTAIETAAGTHPVLLAGHSFGGSLAFDVARQLRARGTAVGWLGIFDTPAPIFDAEDVTLSWSETDWVLRLAGDIEQMTGARLGVDLALAAHGVVATDGARAFEVLAERLVATGWWPADAPRHALAGYLNVYRANLATRYRAPASELDVPVTLFTAAVQDLHGTTPAAAAVQQQPGWGWPQLVRDVSRQEVPGDHLGMLTEPHVAALADAVRAALAPAPFSVPT